MHLYRIFTRIYPKNIRESYFRLLKYAKFKINPDIYVGFTAFLGIMIGLAAAFLTKLALPQVNIFMLWVGFFLLIETLIYVPLMLKVDAIARKVELMLPDVLQLMSSNLKSGLTIDQALLASARPEFGAFEAEINTIGKEIATGKPTAQALLDSSERINSETYKKTMELLASGLRSGGEISKLLDQTSKNLKHQKIVDEKIRSNVMMYVIFIFAAIAIGAPILFGLSSFLVEVLSSIFGDVDIPQNLPSQSFSIPSLNLSEGGITMDFVMVYILTSLTVSSIMGGLIIGLISKGKEKYGFRYIPMLIILSVAIFFIVRVIISYMLGDLLTF